MKEGYSIMLRSQEEKEDNLMYVYSKLELECIYKNYNPSPSRVDDDSEWTVLLSSSSSSSS